MLQLQRKLTYLGCESGALFLVFQYRIQYSSNCASVKKVDNQDAVLWICNHVSFYVSIIEGQISKYKATIALFGC